MPDNDDDGTGGGVNGEYKRPDAEKALEIFESEIAPKQAHMATIKGDLSDPYKRIKDDCHVPRKILDFAIVIADLEEAKRDHFLLALNLLFKELNVFMPSDLVTMAEGEAGGNVIPLGSKPQSDDLVTLSEDDDDGDGEAPFEASEEELAKQQGRGKSKKPVKDEPKDGTGAAARKAMKESASADAATALH